jgi:cytochrome P450 family 142 subfamily A polypeptide 1
LADVDAPPVEIELLSGDFWAGDPHRGLRWLREHHPVWWDERSAAFGVASYQLVREVSRRPDLFSNSGGNVPRAPVLDNMICRDDPSHGQRRRLVNRGFTPRQVRRMDDAVESTCHQLIDRICNRGSADLVADLAAPLPMAVIGTLLGAETDRWPALLGWSDDLMESLAGRSTSADALSRAERAFLEFRAYGRGVLADRQACPGEDLVSALLAGGLGEDALLDELLLLLIGGDETSRHAISGGLHALLSHPHQLAQLEADRSRIPSAVEEVLRWTSPVRMMQRTALHDTVLDDVPVAAGSRLLLLYPAANRDAAVFAEPDSFTVDRQPNEHVAFGFGTHFCLGASLARMEIATVLRAVLDRLPDLCLAGEEDPPVRPAYFVTGLASLPVRFRPTPRRTA